MKNKRIGIIVQARMGSTRLPGKVLREILGKPMLSLFIERIKRISLADKIIIATSQREENDPIVELARNEGVGIFRGSEEDVLSRYYEAARENQFDIIVRLTADCPVIDPEISNAVIQYFLENQPVDYVSNAIKAMFPLGMGTEVFSRKALEEAHKHATEPYQREHATPYMLENMRLLNYDNKKDLSDIRLTVDTPEDFDLITKIYEALYEKNQEFNLSDILCLLKENQHLIKINQHIKQKVS